MRRLRAQGKGDLIFLELHGVALEVLKRDVWWYLRQIYRKFEISNLKRLPFCPVNEGLRALIVRTDIGKIDLSTVLIFYIGYQFGGLFLNNIPVGVWGFKDAF